MSWCCGDYGLRWVARETQNLASLLAGAAVMMGWGWRGEMRRGGWGAVWGYFFTCKNMHAFVCKNMDIGVCFSGLHAVSKTVPDFKMDV